MGIGSDVRRLAGALACLLVGVGACGPGPVVDGDAREVGVAEWALARFEAAGLDLPEVRVVFHDDRSACDGGSGYVTHGDPAEIDVCVLHRHTDRVYRRVLLHELAHVWAHGHLDAAEREAFLVVRGLEEWGRPAPWFRQGREHVAEVIAWGLEEADFGCHTVEPNDSASLEVAFRLLTGVDPPCLRGQP